MLVVYVNEQCVLFLYVARVQISLFTSKKSARVTAQLCENFRSYLCIFYIPSFGQSDRPRCIMGAEFWA